MSLHNEKIKIQELKFIREADVFANRNDVFNFLQRHLKELDVE